MDMLGVEQVVDRPGWVSSTCPFTKWKHGRQVDLRNSFGISVGESSVFHCFSCGSTGALMNLGNSLFLLTGQDHVKLRTFIYSNEHISTGEDSYHIPNTKITTLTPIPQEEIDSRYDTMCAYRGMIQETVDEWGLKYDRDKRRMVIPIKDSNGNTIGLKGRALRDGDLPKYLLYTEFNARDPKSAGIWFGTHYPLNAHKALVLVEGEIDTILVKQAGVSNVWGVMGVGITPAQVETLASVRTPIVFFFDDDKAGHDLKYKLHQTLRGLTRHYHVTDYKGGKDAGAVCTQGNLRAVLRSVQILV